MRTIEEKDEDIARYSHSHNPFLDWPKNYTTKKTQLQMWTKN
jgi:hypothetical protein